MCFVIDYEWYASVCQQTSHPVEAPIRCDECRRTIEVGQITNHIWMQQHEECQTCEDGECECPKDKDGDCVGGCQCAEPDYGEEFDYDRCEDCHNFLEAVRSAELEAGCRSYEAQPALTEMISTIREGGPEDARRYYKEAIRMFPETRQYLGWLWKKMFVR